MAITLQISDPEAALYALDAAACFWSSVATANYGQAVLDAIAIFGWVKLALA